MKGTQFPLTSNSATTGHKLQGCTIDDIIVENWWYQSNWAYVVLSRVREMKGLYIRTALKTDLSKYGADPDLQEMLRIFRTEKSVTSLDDDVLESLIEH
jgi:hypothetical protein